MQAVDLRPLSVGEVLDVAIKIYWRNAATLLGLVVLVVAPVQLLVSLVYLSAVPDYEQGGFLGPAPGEPLDTDELWIQLSATAVGIVLTFLATTLATAACFKAVADAYVGEPSRWRTSLGFAARRIHSVLWVTVLGTVLTALGLLLLVIPAIWLWVSFAVAVPALLTEGVKGRRALGRSRRLVRGRWWPTFGILLLGTILAGIVSGVVGGLLGGLLLTDVGDGELGAVALDAAASTIATVLTTPFTAAFVAVVYFDLRVRKEGFDLQLLAERIGVAPRPGWERPPLPASPLAGPAAGGEQPPYWPPPPGWKPSGDRGEG
ncbi:MAG TPA: hypothetical protein VHF23_05715 [Gaiellaceae bacterium]|nr:hypothetical protein [Gaiellaceae bacterium]